MTCPNRRAFVIRIAVATPLLAAAGATQAAKKRVEENEPKAVTLGYRHDTTQVDKKRFPRHTPAERCNNCVAWLGKSADPWAECDLIADRLVANAGWCSSYVKV